MSLISISYYYRKLMPLAVIGAIFFILFYLTIKFYLAYLDSQKVVPIVINPIFSKISSPTLFDPLDTTHKPITFPDNIAITLDTIEGRPIIATAAAKVFFIPQASTKFGYVQNAYLMAKTFEIDTDQTQYTLEGKNIIFAAPDRTLKIDISNFNFEYKYNYENNLQVFENTTIPDQDTVIEKAKSFLTDVGRYPEELAQGTENVTLFHYDDQTKQFVKVDSVEKANAVEIDYFRPEIDGISMIASKYPYSQNYIVMTFNENTSIVLKSQIKFFDKESEKYGVYPLKTGDQAYQELQNKKATIISNGNGSTDVVIKKMFLSYFDPDFYQEYLEPVFVFLGENGFVAYVPALASDYLTTSEEK
jgi:hypothetical protein